MMIGALQHYNYGIALFSITALVWSGQPGQQRWSMTSGQGKYSHEQGGVEVRPPVEVKRSRLTSALGT